MTTASAELSEQLLATARDRYAAVQNRIAAAAARSGRSPDEIRLVGVAKRQPRERIRAAIQAGVHILGQSYIQETREVRPEIESALATRAASDEALVPKPECPKLEWRMVGRLQRNKAGLAVRLFEAIESVDRIELATALSRRAVDAGRELEILLQVSLCGEDQKGGCAPADLPGLVESVLELPNLRLTGLMTVPAADPDPEAARPVFAELRGLSTELGRIDPALAEGELSMGMSGDLEVAIEEGATLVRVGTALFGDRSVG